MFILITKEGDSMSNSNLSMNVSSIGNYIPSSSGSDSSLKSLEKNYNSLKQKNKKQYNQKIKKKKKKLKNK